MRLLAGWIGCWLILGAGCTAEPAFDPGPDIQGILDDLKGLDAEAFFGASFEQLLLRSPEAVTELGLAEKLGTGHDELDNVSDAYIRNTQMLEAGILELLQEYDREALGPDDRLTFDVYAWYLDDRVRQHRFLYHDYPVNPILTGVQNQLVQFFRDIHPVTSPAEAEAYVARLRAVQEKFAQVREGLRLREAAGIVPPRFLVEWSLHGVNQIAGSRARNLSFYTAFEEKLAALAGLSSPERDDLLRRAEEAVDRSVLPAFRGLAAELEHLQSVAPGDDGVWQFPDGEAYYAWALRHSTTTGLTADEIHELGLQEVARIRAEMQDRFDQLGYPSYESLPLLIGRLAADGGEVAGDEVLAAYEAIIREAEGRLDEAFGVFPRADVIVVGDAVGGFYVPGSLDGSRPGAFYANVSGEPEPRYGMPTLAYHEAVPGHHLQIALAQEQELPLLRNVLSFTGFAEGWALYAERLAWDLGWYDGNPYGDLGRLQAEIFRAARLVVDTGIHARRWTFAQALDYMRENVGWDLTYEVARYVTWPGQATAYKIGMLELLRLRQEAQDRMGAGYDLRDFHRAVLLGGSLPLPILEERVQEYIESAP